MLPTLPTLPSDGSIVGGVLLPIARAAIARELGVVAAAADVSAAWLAEPHATFVTLRLDRALRGCIGSIEARQSLLLDVKANAVGAAFRDPRFPRLRRDEFAGLQIEVSLLSTPERLPAAATEAEMIGRLTPGTDGVILELGARRATFLPQVWESLPEPRDFLAELKQKAGLQEDFWSADLRVSRYTVSKWSEAMAPATGLA
jgi:AmmeMemoRadiSam system protein A